jgi:hypothetical protein
LKRCCCGPYNLRLVISTFEDYIPDWDMLEAEAMGEATSYLNGKVRELKGQVLIEGSSRVSEKETAQEIIDLATEPNSPRRACISAPWREPSIWCSAFRRVSK